MSDQLFFLIQATEYLRKTYGIEPDDIHLTEEGCQWALKEQQTPQEYIDKMADRFDLVKISDFSYDNAVNMMKRFSK